MGAPRAVMDSFPVNIAQGVRPGPQGMTSALKHQSAEIDEENGGYGCGEEKDQAFLRKRGLQVLILRYRRSALMIFSNSFLLDAPV